MGITDTRLQLIKEYQEGNNNAFLELAEGCKSVLNIMCDKYICEDAPIDKDDIEQIFYESIINIINLKITKDNCKYFNIYLNQAMDKSISSIIKNTEKQVFMDFDEMEECIQNQDNDLSMEDSIINSFLHDELIHLMEGRLTKRNMSIVMDYFGFSGDDTATLERVGNKYGISRDRVRQIIENSLRKMRHPSSSKYLKPYLYEEYFEPNNTTAKHISRPKDKNKEDIPINNTITDKEPSIKKPANTTIFSGLYHFEDPARSILEREMSFNRVYQNIVKETIEMNLVNVNGEIQRRLLFDQEKAMFIFDYIGLSVPDDLHVIIDRFLEVLNNGELRNSLYHKFIENPYKFSNMVDLLLEM